jgi:peptidoglycan hydrolase CwlO-like protein
MWTFLTSKTTYMLALWVAIGAGAFYCLHQYNAMKLELSNAKWELAGTQNKLESANYTIERMKQYEQERKDWNKELDTLTAKFKKELDSYSKTLKGIENERKANGVNNSLSEPVTRVLKDFNGK